MAPVCTRKKLRGDWKRWTWPMAWWVISSAPGAGGTWLPKRWSRLLLTSERRDPWRVHRPALRHLHRRLRTHNLCPAALHPHWKGIQLWATSLKNTFLKKYMHSVLVFTVVAPVSHTYTHWPLFSLPYIHSMLFSCESDTKPRYPERKGSAVSPVPDIWSGPDWF